MSVASDSSLEGEGSGPEEITLKEELSIHVALAGITLSHENIPVLGAENPMNEFANAGALILILGVVLAYLSKRLDTRDISLRIVRTFSQVIFFYLIANLVNGTSLYLDAGFSPFQAGLLTFALSVLLTTFVISALGIEGFTDIWTKGIKMERQEELDLSERYGRILGKITVAFLIVLYANIALGGYWWASMFGFLTAFVLIQPFGLLLFREDNLQSDSEGKAETLSVFLMSTAICATIFVGPEWTDLVI